MARPNRKRLAVDLHTKLFERVKRAAQDYNYTITEYVKSSLIYRLKYENRYENIIKEEQENCPKCKGK